ncbi:TRAP-type C4-dicarboxylate transport system permease small subunit [Evansella vedderi]|uniref:TRAP-type C4-dicarboxylate transport system permease small subunit n=1 Tax=Evansella vedderi TaxID=38282 RepID=A0ABT9ZT80_9BACI|nr:TRAP transporter small permease [Evansella vedderi]MDQ0254150.1 TRAP-type C4-dicarboxylate transport system permease small subunit [Evansella vedderi]
MVRGEFSSRVRVLFNIINKISDTLATLTVIGIFIVVIWQITGRLIGQPAPWTEELTRYIFIWMIFLGIGIGFRKAESARVTVFLKYFPKLFKNFSLYIYTLGTLLFFTYMLVAGVGLIQQQANMNETSTVLSFPMWLIGLSIPVSAIVGMLNLFQSLIYDRDLL